MADVGAARAGEPTLLPPAFDSPSGTLGRIRDAALQLFAERGYHGVSIRDITAVVGVQPSSLYAHFGSKEELLAELVTLANQAIHDEVSRAMLETSADPVDQIRTFMTAYVCVHARYPLMTTIAHSDLHALTEDSLATVIAIRKQTVDLLKSIIDRGSAMGVFHCEQPWLVVAAFAGMAVRTAAWYRPPGTPRTTLIDDYPAEVHRSLIPDDFTLDEVASTFADYAVAIVMGVTPQATPPSPFGGRSHG